jgi:hypothetical protein
VLEAIFVIPYKRSSGIASRVKFLVVRENLSGGSRSTISSFSFLRRPLRLPTCATLNRRQYRPKEFQPTIGDGRHSHIFAESAGRDQALDLARIVGLFASRKQKGHSTAVPSRHLFRGDHQVAFVSIELEGLERPGCRGVVGLATGRDRRYVTDTSWSNIPSEPHIQRFAVPTFNEETILLDREYFCTTSILNPAWQCVHGHCVYS